KNDDSTEALAAKNEVLNKQIDLQKQKLKELEKGLQQSADKYGENDRVTQGWQQAVNKATAELNDMERELKKSDNSMSDLGNEMKDTEKKTADLSGKLGSLGSGLASIGKTAAKGAIVGLAAVGTAAAAAVTGIFKFSNDSIKAMNDFQAKTGATKEEMEEFSKVANEIYSNNFGENMGDVANAMSLVKQLTGLAGDELKNAATNAIMLRDVFEYDVAESTRAASTLMKTFGIDANRAYELIAIGAQNGADKNGDLIDTLNEYSNQFKALGFDSDVFLEALIEGAESGAWSIDKIGDAIKEFNIRSKDLSDSSYSAFGDLGFDADQMFSDFAAGGDLANMAFQAVMEALQRMDDPLEKNRIGVALFGTQFEDLEAGVVDVFANLDGRIGESEQAVRGMTDTLQKMSEVKYNDLGSAIEGLKRNILNKLGNVTDIAKESVTNIVKGIQSGDWNMVATSFSEGITGVLSTLLPQVGTTISTVLGSLVQSAVNIIPQVLPSIVNSTLLLLTTIVQVLTTNGPMLIEAGINALMSLITGFVGMLPMLIETGVILLMALVNGIITNLPALMDAAINIVMALIDGILILLPEIIPAAIKAIVTFAKGLIDALPKLIEKLPEIIETIVTVLVDNLPLLITAAYDIIIALAKAMITNLPLIINAAYQIIPAIIGGIISLIGKIPEIALDIINSFKDTFKNIDWASLGSNIIGGIVSGIVGAASSIADSVVSAAKGALDSAKKFLGINSPSTVMRDQVGQMMGAGLARGIEDSTKQVNAAMNSMNNKLVMNGPASIKANSSGGISSGVQNKTEVTHSGTIRVEGVNNKGELIDTIEVTVKNILRKDERVYG
ncbi:MAG: phage tail tape measure protein, partial [Clostridia bacterium]|nr:phage tail tape measure protein [Clostridia bacterium]